MKKYRIQLLIILKICKKFRKKYEFNYSLKVGDHLITQKGEYKGGKNIRWRKTKVKNSKVPLTIIINYNFGLLEMKINV